MQIYLISQYESCGPDTCKSAVVIAQSSIEARWINPMTGLKMTQADWENPYSHWASRPERVVVQHLGIASPGVTHGLYCTNFRHA